MLKQEDAQKLCGVGPGTPMGKVFRSYWIPALLSEELSGPDSPPVRVRLLGEDLVAFRDTNGTVGILDAYCPHRRAELFWGRNEECGLRCVYHGWKFDAAGQCVDTPNEPGTSEFKHTVKLTSYPTWEKSGIVWTYMGPKEQQPDYPDYEWLRTPENYRNISKTFESCNWLQGLEGGIDTSHSSFAHNNNIADKNAMRSKATAPKLEVVKTSYGFKYAGIRDLKEDGNYVRGYQFIMPAQQMRGAMTRWNDGKSEEFPAIAGHVWVPIDDGNVWVFNFLYSADVNIPFTKEFVLEHETAFGRGPDDVLPGYRLKRNPSNDFMIDREVQRTKTFTGISGINTQDYALQETMEKPYCDRTKEKLGTADTAIIVARQLLLEAIQDVETGKMPKGADPETCRSVRGCDKFLAKGIDWKEGLAEDLKAKF